MSDNTGLTDTGNLPIASTLLEVKPTNALDKIGGRKFLLTMTIIVLSFIGLGFHWLDSEVFKYICYLVVITYVGGNITQKIGLNYVDKAKSTTVTPSGN